MREFLTLCACALLCASCSDVPGAMNGEGRIPLAFRARIFPVSRVAGNAFEPGDEVGLYAREGASLWSDVRYLDNVRLSYSASGSFTCVQPMFYPLSGASLHLYAYYPYRSEGVHIQGTTMKVGVKADQSGNDFSESDFLTARLENLSPPSSASASRPVELPFKHRFSLLHFVLTPGEAGVDLSGLNLEEVNLTLHGLGTQTTYDWATDSLYFPTNVQALRPQSVWRLENGCLRGPKLIVIPQRITSEAYLSLEIEGRTYRCDLPEGTSWEGGKEQTVEIAYFPQRDELSSLTGEISDWEASPPLRVSTSFGSVPVTALSFDRSFVYRLLQGDREVGQVCKEYLLNDEVDNQALVLYPMLADGRGPDLSRGRVLCLLGREAESIHGGEVSWSASAPHLLYRSGNEVPIKHICLRRDGSFSFNTPSSDDLPLTATADVLVDVRGDERIEYPVVKVGRTYWLGANLRSKRYRDGQALPHTTAILPDFSGVAELSPGIYYYTADVAARGDLLPVGWELPTWEDWQELLAYLRGAAPLKWGTWRPTSKEGQELPVAAVTNRSLFGLRADGLWVDSYFRSYLGVYASFWVHASVGEGLAEKSVSFASHSDGLLESSRVAGRSVRPIKRR